MVPHRNSNSASFTPSCRKETYGFATLIIILLIISVIITITNLVVIYKLRLIPGFSFFSFIDNNVIFHKDAYIENVLLKQNKISGLSSITGNIALQTGLSSLKLNSDGIRIVSPGGFEVRNPKTGQLLYPFDFSSTPLNTIKTLSVPNGIRDVKMIRSPVDEDLNISANQRIKIRGNDGVKVGGRHIDIDASSIFLASINSSIVLDAHEGIYLNIEALRNRISAHNQSETNIKFQYKLCICGRNGRLFRIPIKDQSTSCADVRFPQSENPCL